MLLNTYIYVGVLWGTHRKRMVTGDVRVAITAAVTLAHATML